MKILNFDRILNEEEYLNACGELVSMGKTLYKN